jgi:hypothetical protein
MKEWVQPIYINYLYYIHIKDYLIQKTKAKDNRHRTGDY